MSTLQEILKKEYDLEDGDILLDDIYVPPKVAVNHLNTLVSEVNNLQKENENLQHQLKIQQEMIENLRKGNEFYSNEENWTIDGHTHEEETYYVREDGEFSVTIRGDVDPSYRYGGKLARECRAKDQELEKRLEEIK